MLKTVAQYFTKAWEDSMNQSATDLFLQFPGSPITFCVFTKVWLFQLLQKKKGGSFSLFPLSLFRSCVIFSFLLLPALEFCFCFLPSSSPEVGCRSSISCCVLWGRSRCQIQTFVTFCLFWVIAACPGGKVRQSRAGSTAIQVFGSCLCHFSLKVNFFQHLCFYYFIGFGVRSLT